MKYTPFWDGGARPGAGRAMALRPFFIEWTKPIAGVQEKGE